MLAPSGVLFFLQTIEFLRGSCLDDAVTMLLYVQCEVHKLFLQIVQTMEQGFHVCPVIRPVALASYFHPIDMLVENLPRRVVVPIIVNAFELPSH